MPRSISQYVMSCRRPSPWALLLSLALMLHVAWTSVAGAQVIDPNIPLRINEVLAVNSSALADPQGEFDDWIEIFNAGTTEIDLAGMYLTDDLDEPTKWRVPTAQPEQTTVAAGGYLLIWADGETTDMPGLHAGFSLSAGGEQVGLYDVDGQTLVDAITFARQRADISFGRVPDGNDTVEYMAVPSPGAPNFRASLGFVADVTFSHDRGFYDMPFSVALECQTEGAMIWYTTDGSEPYVPTGRIITGRVYTGPIGIDGTTCLRAKAILPGWTPSTVRTHTYIFLDDVLDQPPYPAGYPNTWVASDADYGMDPDIVANPRYQGLVKDALRTHRTISLVFDVAALFDLQTGIYINSQREGPAWERPVSMEIIDPCEGREIQVNAGLRLQGNASRSPSRPKHNMRLLFKGTYGPSKLEFPLIEGWPVERFESLILRGSNGDSWIHPNTTQQIRAQYLRDLWPRDTQVAMGRLTAGQCFVHLYLNGLYWGLYHVIERPNASFFAEHLGGQPEDYDVVQHKGGTVDGNRDEWNAMMAIANGGLASTEDYEAIQQYVDVPNLIDWLLVNFYMGNTDWDHNNWYGGRLRAPGAGWYFMTWDSERSFLSLNDNVTGKNNSNQPTRMHQQLTANADYRMRFADHVYRHFFRNGLLTPDRTKACWLDRAEEIRLALVAESARWGDAHRPNDPYTPDDEWQAELDFFCDEYFPQRTGIVLNQIKARGLYPNVEPPTFKVPGGPVPSGFALSMSATAGSIWLTTDGTDPRLSQTAQNDITTKMLVPETAPKAVLVPARDIGDDWRADRPYDDSGWITVTGGPGGVGYDNSTGYENYITTDVGDLMYDINTSCYIRIPFRIDSRLDDWGAMTLRVRYDDGFVAYLNGVEIARRNINGIPAWNSQASSGHSDSSARELEDIDVTAFLEHMRPGENLLAIHGLNNNATSSDFLISVALRVASGGPPADVSPTAIAYTAPLPLSGSAVVKARTLVGDTWSALNEAVFAVGPVAEYLRISELMYHPADPNAEFIELINVGDTAINLNLVTFANGVDFTFPDTPLAPGEYTLVVRDIAAFETRYGAGFNIAGQYAGSLNNAGERIELQDAAGKVIHDFAFRDDWYAITDGPGFSLTVKAPAGVDPNRLSDKSAWRPSAYVGGSPGFDDAGEVPELGDVVINELLANASGAASDWIELHNTTERTIDLGGWFLSDDADDLTKYQIGASTSLPAGGYLVLDADHHFNNTSDPGTRVPFAMSRDGETVHLHSGSDGELTGYSEREKFDASEPGVTMGRHLKSTGAYNFVALSEPTPGAANAAPQVGPVVISEIMYHPDALADAEYVELLNVSDGPVTFYDAGCDAPWRFTDDPDDPGVELLFPTDPPVVLAPGEFLLLVKDVTFFDVRFPADPAVTVLAWGAGNLANGGEKIQLSKPGAENDDGTRNWIRVDRVVYSDGTQPEDFAGGIDPWPIEADGQGRSLTRIDPTTYGNDPANWQAATPTPGQAAAQTPPGQLPMR